MAHPSGKRISEFQRWLHEAPNLDMPSVSTDPSLPILVVGAGPGGLAAMAALQTAGISFDGVESHTDVGGIWDITNPVSSIYEGLRSVTSRLTTHLGVPMPEDWPFHVPHEQVRLYLRSFAERESLLSRITFATRFEGATKSERGTWIATLRTAGKPSVEREVRGLVFATGTFTKDQSLVPERLWTEAQAAGLLTMHSAEYEIPEPFAGKRVLVVGIGNSGSDIAEKISSVAKRTILSVRTSPWINPPTLGGVPCDHLTTLRSRLPMWLGLAGFHLARWRRIGGYRPLGLPRPRHGLNDRLPITDRGIVQAIRQGRVVTRADVTSLKDGIARFSDPRQADEPIDAVIFATGFRRVSPLVPEAGTQKDALLFYMFHRREPGLTYMTEVVGQRSCWPIYVEQARALAAYFVAEARGGPRVAEFNARRQSPSPLCKGTLFRLADEFHLDYSIYTQLLREFVEWISVGQAAIRPTEPVVAAAVPVG